MARPKALRAIELLSTLIAAIGLASLVVLAAASLIDIAGRELLRAPINGFSDLSDLIIVFAAASCFPVSLLERHHVAVRFVGQLHWRLREFLELLGHALLLVTFCVIVWQLTVHCLSVYRSGQATWLLQIPVWPLWTVTTVVIAVCIPAQAFIVWDQIRRLLSPVPIPDLHAATAAKSSQVQERGIMYLTSTYLRLRDYNAQPFGHNSFS